MSNPSGEDLLVFLEEVMDPRTYYQPLIIAELISSDGVMTRRALAERLLIHDETSVVQAERVLYAVAAPDAGKASGVVMSPHLLSSP